MWSSRYQWSLGLINKDHNKGATVMRGDHWHPWLGSGVSSSGWRSPLASHILISLPSEFHALCQGFANPLVLELTGEPPSGGIFLLIRKTKKSQEKKRDAKLCYPLDKKAQKKTFSLKRFWRGRCLNSETIIPQNIFLEQSAFRGHQMA